MQGTPKLKRGFALLSAEERAAISSKGGKRAQEMGTGHRFTSEEAAEAGSKGGKKTQALREKMREKRNG